MAPEQALGNRTLDARSDLYALGCLAYWLVTGKPVFEGSSPIDTIVKHVNVPPDPPSRHTSVEVAPEYDALVLACLAKDPGPAPGDRRRCGGAAPQRGDVPRMDADKARAWWDSLPSAEARYAENFFETPDRELVRPCGRGQRVDDRRFAHPAALLVEASGAVVADCACKPRAAHAAGMRRASASAISVAATPVPRAVRAT